MSQNQEIIEAKLCAYIDGDLDPDGRAEIEKHLEANPQHRRLLESLKATRDLVRWLPRESAPPELAETLNGQLERSVLLDYDGESLRPRIFPRVFAAAAIIILTAGLAAAVYFALPKSHRSAQQIAVNVPEAPKPGDLSGAGGDSSPGRRDAELERAKGAPEHLSKAAASDAMNENPGVKTNELDHMARDVAANSQTIVAAANGAAPQEPAPASINNAVVMLVRTDKPEAAQKELTDYLTTNQIQWRPAETAQSTFAIGAQQDLSSNPAASSTSDGRQENALARPQFAKGGAEAPATSERETQAPAPHGADTQPSQSAVLQQQTPAQVPGPAIQQQANVAGFYNNTNSRASNLYVARMSRSQARALSLTMNQGGQQAAEMKDVNSVQTASREDRSSTGGAARRAGFGAAIHSAAPDTQPASATVQNGDRLAAAVPQDEPVRPAQRLRSTTQPAAADVIAPGDELRLVLAIADLQKKQGAEEPAQTTVRVSPDGTVNLPNIGLFKCAGLTVEQANQQIAQASAASSANRTASAEAPKLERLGALRETLEEKIRVAGATTQPVTTEPVATAQSGDESVNVVIVVEPSAEASVAPNVGPTTQPAQPSAESSQPAPAGQAPPQTQPAK